MAANPVTLICGAVEHWESDGHGVTIRFRRGTMRIEAPAGDILRVRFAPGNAFAAPRSWDVVNPLGKAPLQVAADRTVLALQTTALRTTVSRETGALCCYCGDAPFARDVSGPRWHTASAPDAPGPSGPRDNGLPAGPGGPGLYLDKYMTNDEAYFGFGQRTGQLNRRHRKLTNWTVDPSCPGHRRGDDNMYQAHPVFMAVRPDLAWGLFLHSTWYSTFDAGADREDVLGIFTLGGELDYYLFAGPTPSAVVEQFTRLCGRPALPPLWSLGYHQSRWSYASDREVRAVAAGFRERGIPLDAIHLDIDYMRDFRVFTWDPVRFPDPAAAVAHLRAQDIRTVVITDPGVKDERGAGYAPADEGLAQGHFIKNADGSPFTGYVWPGASLFPDLCRTATRRWWGDCHAGLLEAGVDGIWCDMNEPAIVDRPFHAAGVTEKPIPAEVQQGDDDERVLHAEVHNLYGLLMAKATAEGMARRQPRRRPWVLTRSAYTGVQRYAATWMGDNRSCWEHLEMSLPQVASMGLCGAPHVGVDIGGFYHNAFGELFARWMEVGTFYPFMRCHTSRGSRAQEPWAFGPAVEAVARGAIALRYRLLPYLYTLAHLAHRSGAPLLRPLFYEFPGHPEYYNIEDQLMVGPHLMVAPVYRPGVQRRLVELPHGVWYDFWRGKRVGPGPVVHPAPPGRIPLFVRAGAILTLGNVRSSTAAPLSQLTVAVYSGAEGEWTLVEDDGETRNYEDGGLAETPMAVATPGAATVVTLDERRGLYRPPPRELILQLFLPARPDAVRHNGDHVSHWHWDERRCCMELQWTDDGRAHRVEAMPAGGPLKSGPAADTRRGA